LARRLAGFIALVLTAPLLSAAGRPSLGARSDTPRRIEQWHVGPVRYLMTRTETRQFRRLETDPERVQFIRRFWDRRDPDPRTPENEARLAFWTRVAEANRLFADTPLPGWKTDRGKIYILLGPPNETEENLEFDSGDRTIAGRGLLRWHYSGLERAASRAMTVVAFVHTGDGDWRLTSDPKLTSMFLNIDIQSSAGLPSYLETLIRDIPWGGGSLGTAMDLGRLQEVPTERELMRAAVRSEEFLGTFRGSAVVHTRSGPAGARLAAITVAVPRAELSPAWDGTAAGLALRFAVSAELRPVDPETTDSLPIEIPEESWVAEPAPAEDDPWLRFQAVRAVPAGDWRLSAIVLDRTGRGSATIYEDLDLAPLEGGGPRFDGPLLARSLIPGGEALEGTEPFRIGGHLVVPRMDDVLDPADRLRLFVQVSPPAGLDVPVRLSWQFYRVGDDGQLDAAGEAGVLEDGRGPRAWDLEAARLVPGRYRVEFTGAGDGFLPATRSIGFEIRAAPAADPSL
jgi:GWxTD domain-containing protein